MFNYETSAVRSGLRQSEKKRQMCFECKNILKKQENNFLRD